MLVTLLITTLSFGDISKYGVDMPDLETCEAVSVHLSEIILSETNAQVYSIQCVENKNE